jgi:hypothetical protein
MVTCLAGQPRGSIGRPVDRLPPAAQVTVPLQAPLPMRRVTRPLSEFSLARKRIDRCGEDPVAGVSKAWVVRMGIVCPGFRRVTWPDGPWRSVRGDLGPPPVWRRAPARQARRRGRDRAGLPATAAVRPHPRPAWVEPGCADRGLGTVEDLRPALGRVPAVRSSRSTRENAGVDRRVQRPRRRGHGRGSDGPPGEVVQPRGRTPECNA